jgi:peptidoglycan hydrolase-like protein with peptidoglycan-binding domain
MRQLRLEKPTMRGTDVMDWQTFLVNQSLLTDVADVADGIFGPNTAKASRAYQTRVGIRADGVVGPLRWRALEEV